jgi:hypothetical protein
MHKEFVPYELALDLKELGFNEQCFATYRTHAVGSKKPFEYDLDYHTKVEMSSNVIPINSEYTEESKWISAPLYQQAFRWFREKYSLDVTFRKMDYGPESQFTGYYFSIYKGNELIDIHGADKKGKLYEDSELECLKKLIEIVKSQK